MSVAARRRFGDAPRLVAIDESCDLAESSGGDPLHCYGPGNVMRDYVETPYFVAENSYDQVVHVMGFTLRKAAWVLLGLSEADAAAQASIDVRTCSELLRRAVRCGQQRAGCAPADG